MHLKGRKDPYSLICTKFGFLPGHTEYYEEALTHRSALSAREKNNERLEFLGDAALSLAFSELLYKKFPQKQEGELSVIRARLAKRETLNRISLDMGLGAYLRLSDKLVSPNPDIYGNALEAFCGAVFLDKGYEFFRSFVEKELLEKHLNLQKILTCDSDFKSKLFYLAQKRKLNMKMVLDFHRRDAEGHDFFCTKIYNGATEIAVGTGRTKKESEQNASKMALRKI